VAGNKVSKQLSEAESPERGDVVLTDQSEVVLTDQSEIAC